MSTFNSSTTTANFDNLLLQSLLNRLQIRPPPPPPPITTSHATAAVNDNPLLSSSFEDFLADHLANLSSSDEDDDDDEANYDFGDFGDFGGGDGDGDGEAVAAKKKSRLSKEEARVEKQIIKVILSGNTETLKPNSGQAVSIGDHHICVGFHEEDAGSGYRVWEWHGHIMLFDDDHGYMPEYIYGNYFERVVVGAKRREKMEKKEKEVENCNLGLRELIDDNGCSVGEGSGETRVLHRSRNAGSSRVLKSSSEK